MPAEVIDWLNGAAWWAFGAPSSWVLALRHLRPERPPGLPLTDHDGVPFLQDGLRDGEHLRAAMTGCSSTP